MAQGEPAERTAVLQLRMTEPQHRHIHAVATVNGTTAEVVEKAARLVAKDADLTMAEARAQVWRDNPRLITKSRDAADAPDTKPSDISLAEQVAVAVNDRAMEWTAVPGMSTVPPAEVRRDVWKSPDGRRLQALMRDHRKLSTIQKAKDHPEARAILKAWQKDPKDGLPGHVPPPPR